MAIPSRQIGWGTEENLLWQISKQLESLTGVTYNSKKTLLNVASGENAGAKIETYSGALTGVAGDVFLTVDLDQIQSGIIELSACYTYDSGSATSGRTITYWFNGRTESDGTKFISDYSSNENAGIEYSQAGNLISFYANLGEGYPLQLAYTVKLFTLPLYNA